MTLRTAWSRTRRVVISPGTAILVIAPIFGECLSGATPPLTLLLPWNLAFLAALYGSGALLCREIMRRSSLTFTGFCLLAAAYAVFEEGMVDRFWFDAGYWATTGIGSYSAVWHTNIQIATHLTAFHIAVSMGASIVVVEHLFPGHREQAWASKQGLLMASLALGALFLLSFDIYPEAPAGQVIAAAGLAVGLIATALTRRLKEHPDGTRRAVRGIGWWAFLATALQFGLTYSLWATGLPWPAAVVIGLAPVVAALFGLRRTAASFSDLNALRVVSGIVWFFVLLDVVVGLGGRYDLTAGGLAVGAALLWLRRRAEWAPIRPTVYGGSVS